MRKRMKTLYRQTVIFLVLAGMLAGGIGCLPIEGLKATGYVKAAELERQEELELTEEDVNGGRLRIPAGIYKRILIRGNIRDAAVYLKDVVVEEYISLYGGPEKSITVILSGETNIRKLIVRRNVTVASLDSKQHIVTMSVRDSVEVRLLADIANYSMPTGVTGVKSELCGKVDYLSDKGEGNQHWVYARMEKARLEGKLNVLVAQAKLGRIYLYGEGNRVSIREDVERVTLNGTHVVLSVDEVEAQALEVRATGGTCKLIRPERFGSLTDQSEQIKTKSCDTLFIGDSHTEGLYTRGYLKKGMDALFGRGTAAPHWFNSGRKYLDYFNQLSNYNPEKIVYLYGVNGIQIESNIDHSKQLLQRLMKEYPDAVIYVQRVFPVGDNYTGVDDYQYELFNKNGRLNIADFNKEMKKFCSGYTQLKWTDTTNGLIDKNGNLARGLTDDGLHLNEAGYKIWWSNINEAIGK